MNPLDQIGEVFSLTLANPNAKARSGKEGPRYFATFEVDKEAFDGFMGARELAGIVIEAHCTVTHRNDPNTPQRPAVPGHPEPRPEDGETGRERSYAQELHVKRYWHNSKLWAAMEAAGIYSQNQHKAWIEQQPCHGIAVWKRMDGPHLCRGDVVAHHVTGAALPAAGRGRDNPRKPPHWWTLPACAGFHDWCHGSHGANREDKQKLVEDAAQMMAGQAKAHMKRYLEIESSKDLTPDMVAAFEQEIGLQ